MLAMSRVSPMRCSGWSRRATAPVSYKDALIAVEMFPGAMTLTRTPSSPTSMAAERLKWMTAALAAR